MFLTSEVKAGSFYIMKQKTTGATLAFHWSYIILPLVILLLSMILIACFYHRLPVEVSYHFRADGSPDRWLSRGAIILWMLLPQLFLTLLAIAYSAAANLGSAAQKKTELSLSQSDFNDFSAKLAQACSLGNENVRIAEMRGNKATLAAEGQSVTFSAALLNGPSNHSINVQGTDNIGLTATASATINVITTNTAIDNLITDIKDLESNGTLNHGCTQWKLGIVGADPSIVRRHRSSLLRVYGIMRTLLTLIGQEPAPLVSYCGGAP